MIELLSAATKLKKKKGKEEPPQPVVAHKATKTVFGPTPWTIWFDSGLELVCEEGKDEGRTIPLEYAFQVVGRGLSTEEQRNGWLLFVEDTVSRRQAVLCWNEERDSYYLFHLKGTTNGTYVDRRSGKQWRVGVGSTVEMGYLRFRFQRRLPNWKISAFVLNTLERLGLGPEDAPVKTGLALTIIDGERKGNTFILSRRYHVLHKTVNGDGLLQRGQHADLEHDLLVWSEAAQTYMLLHNPHASAPTYVHAGRPMARFNIFAPVPENCVEVVSDSPLTLRDGDTIRIGNLHLRLHHHIQPLLEGSISHIMQKGYIEKIPTVDVMLENVDAPDEHSGVLEAAASEPPSDDDSGEYEEVYDDGRGSAEQAAVGAWQEERADYAGTSPHQPVAGSRAGWVDPDQAVGAPAGWVDPDQAAVGAPAGWVDPDQAAVGASAGWVDPTRAGSLEAEPAVAAGGAHADPAAGLSTAHEELAPARRVSRVAPGAMRPAAADLDAPRRKPRGTPVARVAPTDEPLPFDPVELAVRPSAPDRGGRKSRHGSPEREPVADETEGEVLSEEGPAAVPGGLEPTPVAAVIEKSAVVEVAREARPPVAAREEPPRPRLAVDPSRAANAPPPPSPRDERVGEGDRRLSLSVAPRKAPEPAPAVVSPRAPVPAAAPTEGLQHYRLEAVNLAGKSAGTIIAEIDVGLQPRLVIGAASSSDLCLDGDPGLAASHAEIEMTARGLVLRPIDGMPMVNKSICVKETLLKVGDELRLTRSSVLRVQAD